MALLKNNLFPHRLPALLLAGILLMACQQRKYQKTKESSEEKEQADVPIIYKKPSSGFKDTLVVAGPAAVFFNPDTLQLGKIRALTEKMVYESNVHDCFFQIKNARSVIKKYWPQVRIIDPVKTRFLLFVKKDKSTRLIDLDAINDMCGLFLFNGKKEPEPADMTNVDTALRQYFGE